MLKIFISVGGPGSQEVDYTRYVTSNSIQITKSLNTPSLLAITMANYDNGFIMPPTHAYIRIFSTKYQRNVYTGFLTNDPTRTFTGLGTRVSDNGQQIFAFAFAFTSDEYMLNIKAVDFIPAFINQSQGFILRSIAETLMPGYFNFDNVASGDLVPYLQYNAQTSWSELAKQFGDASRFRYSAINREIHYQPYGDGNLGIAYDEDKNQGSFDPNALTTSAMTTPIVNDVTIVGQQEAGNNHEDYFIGDGFNGAFELNHQAYGLATAEQGSSILINEPWSATQINTQYWTEQDPSSNFFFGTANSQALNVITGLPQLQGSSFIASLNAIELAGGKTFQHGEFVFNDVCDGIVGGIYDSEILNGYNDLIVNDASCEAGFRITPTPAVHVTISGASGIAIQPFRMGQFVDKSFQVITKVNKSYVLTTNISAPQATRYTQVYRSMAGSVFGNVDPSSVSGNITWSIIETDLFSQQIVNYTFTQSGVPLPVTAIYVPINNFQLNLNLTSTEVTSPIPASLNIRCAIGAGLLSPIFVSGNVQYTGGFVFPSGANLPIAPSGIGPENTFALGTSLQGQAAEIDSGQVVSTLNFYGDALPGVGVRIRLQSWESQAAIARLRDTSSVATEAAVVGDDGVRSTIVTNLDPLPRTSEDCENAAQAFLFDRVSTFYQGTYNASWYFFDQISDDIEFYPTCGRYLYINAPHRNINKQFMLVTAITTSVSELAGEIMSHSITFGPDMHLEKLLATFVPTNPNVLTNLDTSIQPPIQELLTLGTTFLPDPNQATLIEVSGDAVTIQLSDAIPRGCHYEVRQSDLNWGQPGAGLLLVSNITGNFVLLRNAYDQTWYVKFVTDAATMTNVAGPLSRRTKILRVVYPRIPTKPSFLYLDTLNMNFDFSGDIRNIEGITLAGPDTGGAKGKDGRADRPIPQDIFYEAIVGSQQDMALDMVTLRGQEGPGQPVVGTLGAYQIAIVPATQRDFTLYFFNLMWDYGPPLAVHIPPPSAPKIIEGFKFSSSLQIIDTPTDNPTRNDIKTSRLQIASDSNFDFVVVDVMQNGDPGNTVVNVPTTGNLWARMQYFDYVSSGAWSVTLPISQGDLILSTYLNAQGSISPVVSTQLDGTGGIFAFSSTMLSTGGGTITMFNTEFAIGFPDGSQIVVPAASSVFSMAIDAPPQLQPNTQYGFFPVLTNLYNPLVPPTVQFDGPLSNFAVANVQQFVTMFNDGALPLVNGPFVVTTPAAASSGGGGGGGSQGGGNCGILSSRISLVDGSTLPLDKIDLGDFVKTFSGNRCKIVRKDIVIDETYLLITKGGCITRAGQGHVVKEYNGTWISFADLKTKFDNGTHLFVETVKSPHDRIVSIGHCVREKICHIYLEPVDKDNETDDDHIYMLDGIWSHNIMVKVLEPGT